VLYPPTLTAAASPAPGLAAGGEGNSPQGYDSSDVEEEGDATQAASPFEFSSVTSPSRQHYHHLRSLVPGVKATSLVTDLGADFDNAAMPQVLRIGRIVLVRSSLTQAFHYTCTTAS
jgi:hypothetical protein